MTNYKLRWLIKAPLGLILVGAGLCMTIESAFMKHDGKTETNLWIAAGTASLVVFNAGLSIFGSSILDRVRYERQKRKASRSKDN